MTYEETIKALQYLISGESEQYPPDYDIPIRKAIEALEKQIPKKPKEEWSKSPFSDDKGCLFQHLMCPNCGKMEVNKLDDFCPHCGQAINWSDAE